MNAEIDIRLEQVNHRKASLMDFLAQARLAMFGHRIDAQSMPEDLRRFEDTYLQAPGRMLVARHAQFGVVATIACRSYDHRFAQFDFTTTRTVEVVKLYVAPDFRRQGLAGRLFHALHLHTEEMGVQIMYLHTHPFLSGALEFWTKHGFQELLREEDPVWQTVHMVKRLSTSI